MNISDLDFLFPDIKSPELKKLINEHAFTQEFKDGDIIIDNGIPIKFITLVLEGNIKILREEDNGNELLMYYLSPGDTCTMSLTCCMANKQSEIRAIAEGDLKILVIPIDFMDEWMLRFKDWKDFVMNTYRKRFEELLVTIDHIAFKKMDERLLKYLKDKIEVKKTTTLYVTHQEIANDLNSSREVISRLLKQLEKRGVVKLNRNYLDVSNLNQLV